VWDGPSTRSLMESRSPVRPARPSCTISGAPSTQVACPCALTRCELSRWAEVAQLTRPADPGGVQAVLD
jgi:hypothetical protein